jgi:hypothetical protein
VQLEEDLSVKPAVPGKVMSKNLMSFDTMKR